MSARQYTSGRLPIGVQESAREHSAFYIDYYSRVEIASVEFPLKIFPHEMKTSMQSALLPRMAETWLNF